MKTETRDSSEKPGSEVSTASAAGPQVLVTNPQGPVTDPKAGAIYIWEEAEIPLLGCFTVQQVTITSFARDAAGIRAEGTITTCDYTEGGIPFTDEWVATPAPDNPKLIGICPKCNVITDPASEQALFTPSAPHHNAVLRFLGQQIGFFAGVQGGRTLLLPYTPERPLQIVTPRFDGSIGPYQGPCRCNDIVNADVDTPFNLDAVMRFDLHPKGCFKCSCGRMWWSPQDRNENPEQRWCEVGDPAAWEMLVTYNGVAHRLLGCDQRNEPGSGENQTLSLLQTIRDQGWIPF